MQRVNVPKDPSHCTFRILQNMVHSVITAFRYSDNTYGGDIWAIPLKPFPQVLGQGNGGEPSIWEIVGSLLINCLIESGHRAVFRCSISQYSFHIVKYRFMDDSMIIQVATSLDTPLEDTVKLAQKGLNNFAGESKATGVQVSA